MPQHDECSISLVPGVAPRCVFTGLWRRRWSGATTAPSLRCDRQSQARFGFGTAWRATNICGGRQQLGKFGGELERERNSRREFDDRDDQRQWRLCLAG